MGVTPSKTRTCLGVLVAKNLPQVGTTKQVERAILEPFLAPRGSQNRPLGRQFGPKRLPKALGISHGEPPGPDLGATCGRKNFTGVTIFEFRGVPKRPRRAFRHQMVEMVSLGTSFDHFGPSPPRWSKWIILVSFSTISGRVRPDGQNFTGVTPTRSHPKVVPKSPQCRPKTCPKSSRCHPKTSPKSP